MIVINVEVIICETRSNSLLDLKKEKLHERMKPNKGSIAIEYKIIL